MLECHKLARHFTAGLQLSAIKISDLNLDPGDWPILDSILHWIYVRCLRLVVSFPSNLDIGLRQMTKIRQTSLGVLFSALSMMLILTPQASWSQEQWTPELSVTVKRLSDLAFSPDGKQLLYGINTVDLENDAYLNEYVISDLDGQSIETLIEPSAHISAVQWSPDGTKVAYLSSESGKSNIWMIDVSGTADGQQITDLDQDVSSFQWAPSGKAIAFVMPDPEFKQPDVENPDVFNKNHLWLIELEQAETQGKITNLTADQSFTISGWTGGWVYDWSPDSKTIAFAHQERPGLDAMISARLSIVDVETQKTTPVDTGNDGWAYFPRYSPDGKWLAFANAPGEFKWSFLWGLKLVPAEGGPPVELAKSKKPIPIHLGLGV